MLQQPVLNSPRRIQSSEGQVEKPALSTRRRGRAKIMALNGLCILREGKVPLARKSGVSVGKFNMGLTLVSLEPPGLRSVTEHETSEFSAKTKTVLGKLGW